MYGVVSYGCATAAGDSVAELWKALQEGRDFSNNGMLRFQNRGGGSDLEILTRKLSHSFRMMVEQAPSAASNRLLYGNYGVILASTKGRLNDFVWNASAPQLREDPLTPLLHSTLAACELKPWRSVVVSNACSSGLAASRLAQLWLKQGMSDVLVFAADVVSDFVVRGFDSLKLLSDRPPRPFSSDRNGFLLGEAAACMWLTASPNGARATLHTVGLDSEGSAVTRPTASGASLIRAARQIPGLKDSPPDLILAHGTGTVINDQTEDLAFSQLFPEKPLITGSKWCVGHTLAASGAVDMILACEILQKKSVFRLNSTTAIDPAFAGRYLTAGAAMLEAPKRVMVSSLGFGGMHASALLEVAP